ncbi:MAG TPA: hypothetical protein VMH33_04835 [Solirubrobacterales bacterium]|nr:hypothetical protein [Solirubrobacterales bacterium]
MADLPVIACSLAAPDLEERLRRLGELGAASLRSRRREGTKEVLLFDGSAAARRSLEEVVSAERRCCPFLDLRLEDRGEAMMLTIEAPADAAAVAAGLAEAFGATDRSAAPSTGRPLRTGSVKVDPAPWR